MTSSCTQLAAKHKAILTRPIDDRHIYNPILENNYFFFLNQILREVCADRSEQDGERTFFFKKKKPVILPLGIKNTPADLRGLSLFIVESMLYSTCTIYNKM